LSQFDEDHKFKPFQHLPEQKMQHPQRRLEDPLQLHPTTMNQNLEIICLNLLTRKTSLVAQSCAGLE
jgi:hypothetical protein